MENPQSEAERRRLIRERQQHSLFWKVVHLMGSLRLALLLLATISIACIAATITESAFNAKIAQAYIYAHPLFIVWLGVLCLNLFFATLTRWPWQKKHTGFIVTHAGIIMMLVGAMIGFTKGFEATVTLDKTKEPVGRLVGVNRSILMVEGAQTGEFYKIPFDGEIAKPSEARPRRLPLPETDVRMIIDAHSTRLREVPVLLPDGASTSPAGFHIRLHGSMVPEPVEAVLQAGSESNRVFDLFGMARVEAVAELPPPPKPLAARRIPFQESHLIFSKHPDHPVSHSGSDRASGYRVVLFEEKGNWKLRVVSPQGTVSDHALATRPEQVIQVGGTDVEMRVVRFWKDLQVKGGEPVEASSEPNNPAALVQLRGTVEVVPDQAEVPVLYLAHQKDGRVAYRTVRGRQVSAEGFLQIDGRVPTGWPMWDVELVGAFPHSALTKKVVEVPGDGEAGDLIPGLRIRLRSPDGSEGAATWILSGSSRRLQLGAKTVLIGYGIETLPLDFTVQLLDFKVPRYPGTSDPSDYISTVRFQPMQGGEGHEAVVKMNHPASFPPEWWKTWIGLNYKFSQAGWNPDNPNETTLQVLYDPGWFLKWAGSLMICFGIFIMFYLRPAARTGSTRSAPADATPGSTP